jgi:hypothetical protein
MFLFALQIMMRGNCLRSLRTIRTSLGRAESPFAEVVDKVPNAVLPSLTRIRFLCIEELDAKGFFTSFEVFTVSL